MADKILEALEDVGETNAPVVLTDEDLTDDTLNPVVAFVTENYNKARSNRREVEVRWMRSWQNFRGGHISREKFLETERSQVFIKITKTKTLAAYGQIIDIILADNEVPISIEPTPIPLGTTDNAHIDPADAVADDEPIDVIGFEGDGNDSREGESLTDRAIRMAQKFIPGVKLKEGEATKAGQIQVDPAMDSAKQMEKKIKDQMVESGGTSALKSTVLEQVILGTGVMKGPFLREKEYPKWDKEGNYVPVIKPIPESTHVSLWNIYPDPDGTNAQDSEWIIERHRKSQRELARLRDQPSFLRAKVEEAISRGTNYNDEDWELQIREGSSNSTSSRFEVLEYWGIMPAELVNGLEDFDQPEGFDEDLEQYNVNCWICNGVVIRLVINPFTPARLPYHAVPYEEDPYNFFGIGLPENMEDSQVLMNGFMRMAIDNAALSGNIVFEIDEDHLVPGQSLDIYPGKIIRRTGGAPGQAMFAHKFNNTTNENMLVFDKMRQLADESTGIPSALHGQTGISGIGRTASGISMLMNAASLSIKTVIKNLDDYLLEPMAKDYFAFNMQFDFDAQYLGDLEIKSQGVSSLVSREAQSQRLLQLLQVTGGDQRLAARLNAEYVMKELAKSLSLDPKKVTLSDEQAAVQAAIMAASQPQGGQPEGQPGGETNPQNEIAGFAAPPEPGTDQFSANTGEGSE